jgi:hypothetical protein
MSVIDAVPDGAAFRAISLVTAGASNENREIVVLTASATVTARWLNPVTVEDASSLHARDVPDAHDVVAQTLNPSSPVGETSVLAKFSP